MKNARYFFVVATTGQSAPRTFDKNFTGIPALWRGVYGMVSFYGDVPSRPALPWQRADGVMTLFHQYYHISLKARDNMIILKKMA